MVKIYINTPDQLDSQFDYLKSKARNMFHPDATGKMFAVEVEARPVAVKRTPTQNASLHLWLRQLAESLNECGFDNVLDFPWREGMEIPWTEHMTKELLWRPVERAMFGHESTTEAGKFDYGEIYETLCRGLAQKLPGFVPPPWPEQHG